MALEKILQMSKTLGDETRLAIYRYLTTCDHPVPVAEVAERFSLHPNAARAHLNQLEQAGLASSTTDHGAGSGRPPRLYLPSGAGLTPVFAPAAFAALAGMLLELVAAQPGLDASTVSAFGQNLGRLHAGRHAPTGQVVAMTPGFVLAGLERTLAGWGFITKRVDDDPPTLEIRRCPYSDLATRHDGLACSLVHGVLEGMLASASDALSFGTVRGVPGGPGPCCTLRLVEREAEAGARPKGESGR